MILSAALARLLLYCGAALVLGDVASRLRRVFRADGAADEPMRRTVLAGWLLLATGVAALLALQLRALEMDATPESLGALVRETTWGRGWLLLAASTAIGVLAFLLRWPLALQVVAALAIATGMGGLGHAAADESWPITSRLLDAVHVMAAGAWIGGLVLVARHAPNEHQRDVWMRFSGMATVAAPFVLVTGIGAALLRLGDSTLRLAVASDYGRLLLLKSAAALLVAALGAMHHRQARAGRLPLRATVRAELLFALLVFGATSVLTGTSPPGE